MQVDGKGYLAEQTRKVYGNIQYVLNEIGLTWESLVKTIIYTTQPHKNETIAKVKHDFLKGLSSPDETLIGLHDMKCGLYTKNDELGL